MDVRRYDRSDAEAWNAFVEKARNATFLFDRRYMDYHQDRFHDHSLLFFKKGQLMALLPANAEGTTLYSHQGLTYGGLITDLRATAATVCEMFEAMNSYCREQGFERVVYKAIPWIYHDYPSEEALYALTSVCQAKLYRRAVGTTLPLLASHSTFTEARKSGLRKAQRAGLRIEQSRDIAAFWRILDDNLQQNHGTHPVHTQAELQLLAERFPRNILLYMAYDGDEPVGGVLLYLTKTVLHTQYISASQKGKALGAVDALIQQIINDYTSSSEGLNDVGTLPLSEGRNKVSYFDFGTSVIGDQCLLNEPLIFQKEGFGGRAICYDTYSWNIPTPHHPSPSTHRP